MKSGRWLRLALAIVSFGAVTSTQAMTTAGSGSVIVIPLLVQTASFTGEVTVRNLGSAVLTLDVRYYDALNTLTPGQLPCAQFVLQPNESRPFTLGAQCTLGAGGHFGLLILEDADANEKTHLFTAFSRTENPSKIGFSVEGYPIGYFSGQVASVTGLKRVTNATPTIQTNCFVAALAEAVDYSIKLFDGTTNVQIGNTVSGSLLPFQMFRYLDVFAAAAAPAGNHLNVRAEFNDTNTDPAEPAFVGFCTVQENTTTGGDFRIAKSMDAHDLGQARAMCTGTSGTCSLAAPLSASPWTLGGSANKDIFGMVIRSPDYVRCDILGPNADNLELRIREPGTINATPVRAGGSDVKTFYFFTGPRNQVNNGTANNWFIEVSSRESAPPAAFPAAYGLYCASGNGVTQTRRTSSGFADDF